mmetsp:Transcript_18302/g.48279  ORF Transcript_18302/g.48279 Transcript_18302/m.48279 type:complete len:225 (+) Transcript_18302:583-1257(+)
MACWTAAMAALASATVCSFLSLAAARSAAEVAIALVRSAREAASSDTFCPSSAISAVRSSTAALSLLTSSVLASLLTLFAPTSASHQPLCSVSAVASSINLTIRSLTIFLTFSKGSAATRSATSERSLLPVLRARSARNCARLSCSGVPRRPPCSCARAARGVCSSAAAETAPKCFSPAPSTASPEMTSTALRIASSSSARSFCRAAKSEALPRQSSLRPPRYS